MNSTTGEGGEPGGRQSGDVTEGSGPPVRLAGPAHVVNIFLPGHFVTGTSASVAHLHQPAGATPVQRLHDVLAGAGFDLTAGELADALWLALAQGAPEPVVTAVPVAPPPLPAPPPQPGYSGPAPSDPGPPRTAPRLPPPVRPPAPEPEPAPPRPAPSRPEPAPRRPVYALAGARPGGGAAPVRVPGAPGLPNPLDVVRALRPLKRRVSSLHRFELDEAATAEAIADTGGPDIVLRPERARWLDLVLAVDDGPGLRVWQDTLTELTRVLGTSGIFRTVRRVGFATTPVNSAVVDGNRTAVLAVTDGVGPGWRSGAAHRTLAAWARKAPTAVLHPLPPRRWQDTALAAERLRVRSARPAPANHSLRAYDPWLPPNLAEPLELPVPVLELGDWSLGPWASLIASHGGTADLHVVDAAAPVPPTPGPATAVDPVARLVAFQETAGPEAYELAAHLAAVDPLTLPVMRVVQSAALPGTSPSCLAEVLLSGLMRVEAPLGGFDVYTFDPEIRGLLRTAVPATDARRTVDAVTAYLTPRLGRAPDFPALIAARTGTLSLPPEAAPFAELPAPAEEPDPYAELPPHPSERYVVAVWDEGGERPRSGYLVADRLILTAARDRSAEPPARVLAEVSADDAHLRPYLAEYHDDARLPAGLLAASGEALLYEVEDPAGFGFRVPPLLFGHVPIREGGHPSYGGVTAYAEYDREFGRPRPGWNVARLTRTEVRRHAYWPLFLTSAEEFASPDSYVVVPSAPRFANTDCVLTGAAVFDGNALCGIVPASAEPPSRSGPRDLLPTPVFAQDLVFLAALGFPRTDLDRPGSPLPPEAADAPPPPGSAPRSAPPAPDTARDLAPPPAPDGLSLDEGHALREVERAALPTDGYASGTLVLLGPEGGPQAVAAAFAAEHRVEFSGVVWYRRVVYPRPVPPAGRDDPPLLAVLDGCEEGPPLPERGLVVLALGERFAGLGYQEIRIGAGPAARRADRGLVVTPTPGPRPYGDREVADQAVRVSGNLPGQVLDDLLRMLPWLGGTLSFDVLGVLWPAGPLSVALGALGESGSLAVSWGRREVSLRPGQRTLRVMRGRELAEWMLLGAYGEERPLYRPRHDPGEEELAGYVLALSGIPPEEDGEYSARLLARAARHLLRYGDARTGVRLAERVLAYADRRPPTAPPFPLAIASRAELAILAVESGLSAFLALSSATVAEYGAVASASPASLLRIHRELGADLAAYEAGDASVLPALRSAPEWVANTVGRLDPLTEAVRTAMAGFERPAE